MILPYKASNRFLKRLRLEIEATNKKLMSIWLSVHDVELYLKFKA